MRKAFYYLGIMPYNGEPSRVWLILSSVFFAWSTMRKRIQIDISWFDDNTRQKGEGKKKESEIVDLPIM